MALLPKQVCQVRDVEFARFITLTSSSIEPLSFTVPRVKVTNPSIYSFILFHRLSSFYLKNKKLFFTQKLKIHDLENQKNQNFDKFCLKN